MTLSPTVILCILRGMLMSFRHWTVISGHSYVEQDEEEGQPSNVQVLKCSLCGHVSVGWTRGANTRG